MCVCVCEAAREQTPHDPNHSNIARMGTARNDTSTPFAPLFSFSSEAQLAQVAIAHILVSEQNAMAQHLFDGSQGTRKLIISWRKATYKETAFHNWHRGYDSYGDDSIFTTDDGRDYRP